MSHSAVIAGEGQLIQQPLKRLSLAKQAEVGKKLKDIQQPGDTEESNRSWSSPVVHVWKKTGDICFCENYRKLNDCFPLPGTNSLQPNGSPL
jgi:hypothetical protein